MEYTDAFTVVADTGAVWTLIGVGRGPADGAHVLGPVHRFAARCTASRSGAC